ncbi:MAG: T9SS type A sorting domain-containing protein [bacterium]|nr:T9SS type A sorting domain-containing protein [bacterium]
MRRRLHLLSVFAILIVTSLAAQAGSELILLDSASGSDPDFRIIQDRGESLSIEFRLPSLHLETVTAANELFHTLSIEGGSTRGAPGQAEIPCITRFITLPVGLSANVRLLNTEEKSFAGYRLHPVQQGDEGEFLIDRDWYRNSGLQTRASVELGEEGVLRDFRVVPITFSPVTYDPAKGELTIASRMEVEIEFHPSDRAADEPVGRELIPESFDRLYRDMVINYRTADRADGTRVGPGTYLLLCNASVGVTQRILPLANWRRRQGYNVVIEAFPTNVSTNTVKSIIQNVYDTVDPPLEHITIVGDVDGPYGMPCWQEGLSGFRGEGDHYYTTLAGDDILPEAHIGRLSFETTTQLENMVDKIITYETNPPVDDAGWFTSAVLTADPFTQSGISPVYVTRWLEQELLAIGFDEIDFIDFGNFSNLMVQGLNRGCSVFSYRGIGGMSGFQAPHALYLSNGYRLPFALFPTCDTGSFAVDNCCRSEGFIRAENGGAIGAIGTATIGTHTRYNNCFFHGVWEGAINGSDHKSGVALTRGKLELYNNYFSFEPNSAEIWTVWNNLMGDPASDLWLAYPELITAEYPAELPELATSVPVHVESVGGNLEGALVTLYREGEFRVSAYSDLNGDAVLPIANLTPGTLLVTVTKHNQRPHLGELTVGGVGPYAAYSGCVIDDDDLGSSSGNDNGELNPGEAIELGVSLTNGGSSATGSVSGVISTTDPYVTITSQSSSWGSIAAGATVWSLAEFDLSIPAATPDGHVVNLLLDATDGVNTWRSLIPITVQCAAFDYQGFTWDGGGDQLDPGETGGFHISVVNSGSLIAAEAVGTLTTDSAWVTILDGTHEFGTIGLGGTGTGDFNMAIDSNCYGGSLISFTLELVFNNGQTDMVEIQLPVGTAIATDPSGPDGFGYYAFDNTDTAWEEAPEFDWIEIDPLLGGHGETLNLEDFGWGEDDIRTITLPFTFKYYGQDFNQISICSNGWVAMGATQLVHFRNFSLPCAGSPNPLIAVFWDNLVEYGNGRIYTYYDEEQHRLIVEWSRLRNFINTSVDEEQTCQVIFYDPAWYPTQTGDGKILMQYLTVANTDYINGYATVGIQNLNGSDGVLYTYANSYASGAAQLTSGRAIMFQPLITSRLGTLSGTVTNASNGDAPIDGAVIHIERLNRTLMSNSDGEYVGRLTPDSYTLRAEHESFESVTVSDIPIIEDVVTTRDFSLVDILGPAIQNTTVLPFTNDTTGPYVVDTWITDYSPIDDLTFHYSIGNSGDNELSMILVDEETGHYRAEIPGYPLNTRIRYWIECDDLANNVSRDPATPDSYYTFWILNELLVFDDDMETDLGWSVGDDDDGATSGIWVREDPVGAYLNQDPVQPEDDVSAIGSRCWVTGNNETGNQGADDIDGGKTTLFSPIFNLADGVNVSVNYYRWYTNNTGNYPNEDSWVVSVTADGAEWVDLENTNSSNRSWNLQTFTLDDYIDLTDHVQFRFVASDLNGGSVVEAALDEFNINGFVAPDPTYMPGGPAPANLVLLPNMPNPFNPATQIRFGLPASGQVDLKVYDTGGRLVRVLASKRRMDAGYHTISWNGQDDRNHQVSSGIYFYVLNTQAQTLSGKMTLLK